MPLQKQVTVVCAIIENNGKILAAQRGPRSSLAGFWEFPGGKIEAGETAEQALHREIREELGIALSVIRSLPMSAYSYPDLTVTLLPFVCTLNNEKPQLLEHSEMQWVDKTEAALLKWLPPDVAIVEHYFSGKSAAEF